MLCYVLMYIYRLGILTHVYTVCLLCVRHGTAIFGALADWIPSQIFDENCLCWTCATDSTRLKSFACIYRI